MTSRQNRAMPCAALDHFTAEPIALGCAHLAPADCVAVIARPMHALLPHADSFHLCDMAGSRRSVNAEHHEG
jgi:hypothetical protein